MSISINKMVGYGSFETDKQRNRAENFINKDDKEISRIAARSVSINNYKSNKNFAKNINTAFNSIPFVAVASGLIMKRGIKPSLKNGAEWGLAVAIPSVIGKLNRKAVETNDSLKSAERKHEGISFGAEIGLALAGFFGATTLLDKASKHPKVNKVVDTVIADAKSTFGKIKNEIKVPENITQALSNAKEKVKIPEFVKTGFNKVANSNAFNNILQTGKAVAKKAVNNAPMLVALGVIGAIVGTAIKQSSQISATKSAIKNSQLDVARELVDVYKQENEELKSQQA
jgi:hypothetical protein